MHAGPLVRGPDGLLAKQHASEDSLAAFMEGGLTGSHTRKDGKVVVHLASESSKDSRRRPSHQVCSPTHSSSILAGTF